MNLGWAFFILAVMLVASGGVFALGAVIARRRSYEEFILNKNSRNKGNRP